MRQDIQTETSSGPQRLDIPWPEPQFLAPYGAMYGLVDCLDCLDGRLDEPKNSGRRVGIAIEVTIGLKVSAARGGEKVSFPLQDRSARLEYDWFR